MRLGIILIFVALCCLAITDANRRGNKKNKSLNPGVQRRMIRRLLQNGAIQDHPGPMPMLPRRRGRPGRNRQGRPNNRRMLKQIWKLKLCSNQCTDCGNSSVCIQNCNSSCEGKNSVPLCVKECIVNDCMPPSCTSCCRRALPAIKRECRREKCASQCRLKPRRNRNKRLCKRCMRENCFQDESSEDTEEESILPENNEDAEITTAISPHSDLE